MTSHRLRKPAFLAGVATLANCSSVNSVYHDVVHQIAPADTTRFYVGKAGVTLYEEPNFSSTRVA